LEELAMVEPSMTALKGAEKSFGIFFRMEKGIATMQ
jgi:hypothetical protein